MENKCRSNRDLELICLDKPEGWDAELKQFRGSLFMSKIFLESIPASSGIPVYFKILKNKETIALLSGLSRPVGKNSHFRQLFFYAGFASHFNDPETLINCKSELIRFAKANSIARLFFRSYDDTSSRDATVKELVFTRKRYEFVFDLTKNKDDIFQDFDSDVRRRVRNSLKNKNIVFGQNSSFDFYEEFIRLIEGTREVRSSKGYPGYDAFAVPIINKTVVKNLLESGSAAFFYLKESNAIICIVFTIMSTDRVYGAFMGTSKRGYELAAPSRLIYETIMYFKDENFYSYNLGGLPDGPENHGIRKFKENMGPGVFHSNEEDTYFLIAPFSRYNLALRLKRKLLNMPFNYRVKKIIRKAFHILMKNTDQL